MGQRRFADKRQCERRKFSAKSSPRRAVLVICGAVMGESRRTTKFLREAVGPEVAAKLEAVRSNLEKAKQALAARRAARIESDDYGGARRNGAKPAPWHRFAISLTPTMPDTGFCLGRCYPWSRKVIVTCGVCRKLAAQPLRSMAEQVTPPPLVLSVNCIHDGVFYPRRNRAAVHAKPICPQACSPLSPAATRRRSTRPSATFTPCRPPFGVRRVGLKCKPHIKNSRNR